MYWDCSPTVVRVIRSEISTMHYGTRKRTELELGLIHTDMALKLLLRVGEGGYGRPLQEPRNKNQGPYNAAATRQPTGLMVASPNQRSIFAS